MSRFTQTKVSTKEKIGTILDKDVAENCATALGKRIAPSAISSRMRYRDIFRWKGETATFVCKRRWTCSRPFNLTRAELETLMQEDYFEQ